MALSLKDSNTKNNLMIAFAGESQARSRYTFAAVEANNQKLYVLEWIFKYTANQELAHANIYYNHLKELSGFDIQVDYRYPVNISDNILDILKESQKTELKEHTEEYPRFSKMAKEDGFEQIAKSFDMIAQIEKIHADRLNIFSKKLESSTLFKSDKEVEWLCTNCGHVHKGFGAPINCPVCKHPQGYFIESSLVNFK